MSALITVGPPGVDNILSALSSLPGSPNGSAVVSFADSNVNVLPPLPGPNQVGAHTFSLVDYSSHSASFCDAGDFDNPDALCNQPREIRVTMLYVQCSPAPSFYTFLVCHKLLIVFHEAILRALLRKLRILPRS